MAAIWRTVYRYAAQAKVWAPPFGANERTQLLIADDLLRRVANFAQAYGKRNKSVMSPACAGAVCYVLRFAGYSTDSIEKYLDAVAFGSGRPNRTPVSKVRAYMQNRLNHRAAGSSVAFDSFCAVLHGFVLHQDGRDVKRFILPEFPKVERLNLADLKKKVRVKETSVHNAQRPEGL